jgi:hypothetical protein
MLVECINDKDWHPEALKWIKNFPVKGDAYTVIGRTHTKVNGLGYILEELDNPPLPCGTPVGFSAKRFKPLSDIDLTELTEVFENENLQTA